MGKFRTYITEQEKNKHLEHLEDEVLNRGIDGLRDSINFLRGLRNMLAGTAKSKVNVTVKWDGAPAIVTGTDPVSKKFFLATKSAFNKTPKLNFSVPDIYKNHSGPLADTLAYIFPLLKSLNIKEVIQGDLLYTKDDLKIVEIDGEPSVVFRPNTITYASPAKSPLGQKILSSKMGVVFHTTYHGKTIVNMEASFGANVDKYKGTKAAWVNDAYYHDESGTVTMTKDETAEVTSLLGLAGHEIQKLDKKFINFIAKDETIKTLIKTYNNAKVRAGQPIGDVQSHVHGLIQFIDAKYSKEIAALKTEKGKNKRRDELEQVKSTFDRSVGQLHSLFEIQNLLTRAKNIIIKKLQAIKSIGTFLETEDGFKVTSPEGFVAIDNVSGKAVKLVDRLEFSYANFNAAKSW